MLQEKSAHFGVKINTVLKFVAATVWDVGMTRLVGLTGGIACGKSLVASELCNFYVIDCDRIARECTRKVRVNRELM